MIARRPCFSIDEVILLVFICEGADLIRLRSVVLDDFNKGRYSSTDFENMWILIDKCLQRKR